MPPRRNSPIRGETCPPTTIAQSIHHVSVELNSGMPSLSPECTTPLRHANVALELLANVSQRRYMAHSTTPQLLINALTGQVGFSTDMPGNPIYQALTQRAILRKTPQQQSLHFILSQDLKQPLGKEEGD